MRLRRRWVIGCTAVVVAVPVAGYGYLAWTTHDAPAPATLHPRDTTASSGSDGAIVTKLDGDWSIVAESGFVGYRVREKLGPISAPSDAVGRSSAVAGTATFVDHELRSLVVVVDMRALRSDVGSRDELMREQGLETDTFPTARFELDTPIRFDDARLGTVTDADLHGRLTLHGQTKPVDVPVHARWDGGTIQVAGSATMRLHDFAIDLSGLPGFRIDDRGTFEFELTLSHSGQAVTATPSTILAQPVTPTGEPEDPPCPASSPAIDLPAALLFTAYTENGPEIWVVGPGTQPPRFLVKDATDPAWSPDGSMIAFATAPRGPEPPSLRIADANGQALRIIGQAGAALPDWSPDGSSLVFAKARAGADTSEIWVVGADGSNARRLSGIVDDDGQPRWTPDGSRIVFTRHTAASNDDVMIMNADGTSVETLFGSDAYEYSGSIQNGHLLHAIDGRIHIAASTDPSQDAPLTDGPNDGDPALAADATTVAFVHQANIYLTTTGRHDRTCLGAGVSVQGGLRWAPPATG